MRSLLAKAQKTHEGVFLENVPEEAYSKGLWDSEPKKKDLKPGSRNELNKKEHEWVRWK
jgi:hypothetical protein